MNKKWKSEYRKTNADGEALAAALRACRQEFGETQVEFARRFDISAFTYLRWEKYGPPNTSAHRQFVRMMLEKLHAQKKRSDAAKNARLRSAAD
jgi:DNA-binding XRE family transcriptional regulator